MVRVAEAVGVVEGEEDGKEDGVRKKNTLAVLQHTGLPDL